ncbi:TPA: hypothetical protein QDB45_001645 [Burkholderia vietnamiensis]|nr:hypothetical protein [Burkholderia vietnamiensis]
MQQLDPQTESNRRATAAYVENALAEGKITVEEAVSTLRSYGPLWDDEAELARYSPSIHAMYKQREQEALRAAVEEAETAVTSRPRRRM